MPDFGEFHRNETLAPGIRPEPVVVRRGVVGVGDDAEDRRAGVLAQDEVVPPMRVLRISCGLGQNRIVVEDHAGGAAGQTSRPAGQVVGDIADPIYRPAERRLIAERVRRVIDRDVIVARAGEIGEDSGADILEFAPLDGQPLRAEQELRAGEDAVVGVAEVMPSK